MTAKSVLGRPQGLRPRAPPRPAPQGACPHLPFLATPLVSQQYSFQKNVFTAHAILDIVSNIIR